MEITEPTDEIKEETAIDETVEREYPFTIILSEPIPYVPGSEKNMIDKLVFKRKPNCGDLMEVPGDAMQEGKIFKIVIPIIASMLDFPVEFVKRLNPGDLSRVVEEYNDFFGSFLAGIGEQASG